VPLDRTVRKFRNNYLSSGKVFPDWQARFRLWCDEDEQRRDSPATGWAGLIELEGWVSAGSGGDDEPDDAPLRRLVHGHA
jgi:hypothetical protein